MLEHEQIATSSIDGEGCWRDPIARSSWDFVRHYREYSFPDVMTSAAVRTFVRLHW